MRAHNDMAPVNDSCRRLDGEQFSAAAEVLALLADPTRLQLLRLLAGAELDVTHLSGEVAASRSSVSQHLGRLRLAGLVTARRDGRHMYYRITSDHLSGLVEEALLFADHEIRGLAHHRRQGTRA